MNVSQAIVSLYIVVIVRFMYVHAGGSNAIFGSETGQTGVNPSQAKGLFRQQISAVLCAVPLEPPRSCMQAAHRNGCACSVGTDTMACQSLTCG